MIRTSLCLLFAAALSLAQQPPAEFLNLQIDYRASAAGAIVEARSGELRLNKADLLGVNRLWVPKLNSRGVVTSRNISIVRNGQVIVLATAPSEVSATAISWALPEAQNGDIIRFDLEQDIDVVRVNGAWWFASAAKITLPVVRGKVSLQTNPGFSGSVAPMTPAESAPNKWSWSLDGVASASSSHHFVISSFRDWAEYWNWAKASCSADPGPQLRAFVSAIPKTLTSLDHASNIAAALSQRLSVLGENSGPQILPCRPTNEIFSSRRGTPAEVAAVFTAALTASGIPSNRFATAVQPPNAVNPTAIKNILIRVNAENQSRWFNAARLPREVLALAPGEVALGVSAVSTWSAINLSHPPGTVTARLEATVTDTGSLIGSVTITANGAAGELYRAAFRPGSDNVGVRLLGPFIAARQALWVPLTSDPDDYQKPFTVFVPFQDADFFHFQRSYLLEPNVLDFAAPVAAAIPGVFLEEIQIDFPVGFSTVTYAPSKNSQTSLIYSSQSSFTTRRLTSVRLFEILPSSPEAIKSDFDALKLPTDPRRQFNIRRVAAVDTSKWENTVPPHLTHDYGIRALRNRDYDTASRLLVRTTQTNPKDTSAWNNLGRVYLAQNRLDLAQAAFEKQIEVDPNDEYAYNNLGLTYLRQDLYDDAIKNFQKQLSINPKDSFALGNLPNAYFRAKRFAEAEVAYTRSDSLLPSTPQRLLIGTAYKVCAGKSKDPAADVENALGGLPSPPMFNDVADLLASCRTSLDVAEKYSNLAVGRLPPQPPVAPTRIASAFNIQSVFSGFLFTSGRILAEKEQWSEAVEALRLAAATTSRSVVWMDLARAELKLGNISEAVKWWQAILRQDPWRKRQLPDQLKDQLPKADSDGHWQPLPSNPVLKWEHEIPAYFYVNTRGTGEPLIARALGPSPEALALIPAVRQLTFPVVRWNNQTMAVARIVKIAKQGSATVAYQSMATEAQLLAEDLSPDDFPLPPQPPTPPPTAQ